MSPCPACSNGVRCRVHRVFPEAPRPAKTVLCTDANALTLKELIAHLDDLKITSRQKEFVKAALRAMTTAALMKRFACKVDI